MMPEKYTLKYGKHSAQFLADQFVGRYAEAAHQTSLYFLCALTLGKFVDKLNNYSRSVNAQTMKTFTINRREALAFHLMYRNGYIDTVDPLVNELFTKIDRTL